MIYAKNRLALFVLAPIYTVIAIFKEYNKDLRGVILFKLIAIRSLCVVVGVLTSLSLVASPNADPLEWEYQIFEKDHKKGLLDSKRKVVIPAEYDDLGWSNGAQVVAEGVIGYKENGLWGLINLRNEKVIVPNYTHLAPFKDNWIIAARKIEDNGKDTYGVINTKGHSIIPFSYAYLTPFHYNLIAARYSNGKVLFGVIDETGEQVVTFRYKNIKPLTNALAQIDEDGRLGLINPSGRVVTPAVYEKFRANNQGGWEGKPLTNFQIRNSQNKIIQEVAARELQILDKNVYSMSVGKHWDLKDLQGKTIKSYYNFSIVPLGNGYSYIRKRGKVGLINGTGKMILPPVYDSIKVDKAHFMIYTKSKWSVMDLRGKIISQRFYDGVENIEGGLFPVKRQGDWGLMDLNGTEKVAPQYQTIGAFTYGLAVAKYFGSIGVIDNKGNWRVKPRYNKVEILDQSHFAFQGNGKSGLINGSGREVYATTHLLERTKKAFLQVSDQGEKGLVTTDGRVLLPVAYSELEPIENHPDLFTYRDSLGVNIIGLDGQLHLQLDLQEVKGFSEDFFGVKLEDQYGFIDKNGKLRIANRYNDIDLYSEGKAAVKIRNSWGYIDKIERIRIQPTFEMALPFHNGIALVKKNGKWGLIDEFGKVVLPLNYDNITRTEKGKFVCQVNKKKGLANTKGLLIVYPKYDTIEDLDNGYVIVSRNQKYGLLTQEGESTIPMIYEQIVYDPSNELYITHQESEWQSL